MLSCGANSILPEFLFLIPLISYQLHLYFCIHIHVLETVMASMTPMIRQLESLAIDTQMYLGLMLRFLSSVLKKSENFYIILKAIHSTPTASYRNYEFTFGFRLFRLYCFFLGSLSFSVLDECIVLPLVKPQVQININSNEVQQFNFWILRYIEFE